MAKPYEKEGYEEAPAAQAHRIRITLTSRDVKNLEKGNSNSDNIFMTSSTLLSVCRVDHWCKEQKSSCERTS